MLLYLCIQADAYATLIPFFYKGRYHGQMGWDWGFKASCEMEVAVVDRNKKLLRFIKIRFGGAPIKSVSFGLFTRGEIFHIRIWSAG
jgi:hypothetical protein